MKRFRCGHVRHRMNTGFEESGRAFCRVCRSVIDARYHARERTTLADIIAGPRFERLIRGHGEVYMKSEPLRAVPVLAVSDEGSPIHFAT